MQRERHGESWAQGEKSCREKGMGRDGHRERSHAERKAWGELGTGGEVMQRERHGERWAQGEKSCREKGMGRAGHRERSHAERKEHRERMTWSEEGIGTEGRGQRRA